jgi:hypothetical protein
VDFKINSVRIYLNSAGVPGWNEIDAVRLLDNSGLTQWAVQAEASSSFAEVASPQGPRKVTSGRNWGPEQVTGEPDTRGSGDIVTAWASLTPDGQDEWLVLEYEERVVPVRIEIHETFNPGAVNKVGVFSADRNEVEVWSGTDPTPIGSGRGVSKIPISVDFRTNRVKIYLASAKVRGWNEIDAVGLVDAEGNTHWAVAAEASSTYATRSRGVIEPPRASSIFGEPLGSLDRFKLALEPETIKDKRILVCFWDMYQRPSRHMVRQLAKHTGKLKEKGVIIVLVQASKVDEDALKQWVDRYKISLPVGMIEGDAEEARLSWGVQGLPWLTLTDRRHIVRAEGLTWHELHEKLAPIALNLGQVAPDFELPRLTIETDNQGEPIGKISTETVKLSSFRGKLPVFLIFSSYT